MTNEAVLEKIRAYRERHPSAQFDVHVASDIWEAILDAPDGLPGFEKQVMALGLPRFVSADAQVFRSSALLPGTVLVISQTRKSDFGTGHRIR